MYNRWTDNEVKALLSLDSLDGVQHSFYWFSKCHQPDLHNFAGTFGHGGNADNSGPQETFIRDENYKKNPGTFGRNAP